MQSRPSPAPARTEAQRTLRYNHLIERLRNRQITMEEATELFGLMNSMLRASEAARMAQAASAATEPKSHAPLRGKAQGPSTPAADDLIVAGILAMGAGAGLLAAITKRMAENAAAPASGGRSETRPPSR